MKTKNQQFLEEVNKAFARSDSDFVLDHVTDDIKWSVAGDFTVQGKEAFARELKKMESPDPFELSISNIITHGRSAAVDGTMKSPDGKTYAFCDVYQFSGLKNPRIKEMNSYVVEVK
jgi:hypothetical protein